jgi:hypothetical protein
VRKRYPAQIRQRILVTSQHNLNKLSRNTICSQHVCFHPPPPQSSTYERTIIPTSWHYQTKRNSPGFGPSYSPSSACQHQATDPGGPFVNPVCSGSKLPNKIYTFNLNRSGTFITNFSTIKFYCTVSLRRQEMRFHL